jgi:Acyl-CoA dehydrogenase, N-terminal domain
MTYIAERLRADIRKLAPDIAARAAEIEAARRLPPDLVKTLRSIAVFRMFAPHSQGGLELDLPTALEVIASLTRIDGSVGWNVAICNGGHAFGMPADRSMVTRSEGGTTFSTCWANAAPVQASASRTRNATRAFHTVSLRFILSRASRVLTVGMSRGSVTIAHQPMATTRYCGLLQLMSDE